MAIMLTETLVAYFIIFDKKTGTRMWADGPMPNVMAAQPNIGGALCKSSVIPFLVQCYKVWLTAAARVPCSNTANIGECKTCTLSEFCKNSVREQEPQKCIYKGKERKSIYIALFWPRWYTQTLRHGSHSFTCK